MHRVKGLEFSYIFAAGVNNKALPNGVRSDFSDDVSLEEFETGREVFALCGADKSQGRSVCDLLWYNVEFDCVRRWKMDADARGCLRVPDRGD